MIGAGIFAEHPMKPRPQLTFDYELIAEPDDLVSPPERRVRRSF
jgi:hypothetical protein